MTDHQRHVHVHQQPIAPPHSGNATASLVLALLGPCSFGILSVVAVILGHLALHETRGGAKTGRGQAVAGLILGYPLAVFAVFALVGGAFGGVTP